MFPFLNRNHVSTTQANIIVMEQEIKKFLRLQIFGAFPENRATCLGPLILDQFWICGLLLFCFFEMKKKKQKKNIKHLNIATH